MEIQTHAPELIGGASTKPKEIDLKAAEFNDTWSMRNSDTLADRRREGDGQGHSVNATQQYALYPGGTSSPRLQTAAWLPRRIIPPQNPYALKAGQT